MGGCHRCSLGDWLRRHRRFRRGLWQNKGNRARIPKTRHWLSYKLKKPNNRSSNTEVENFLFANVLWTAVGTKQLLISRIGGFIPRKVGGKIFISCRLTTHTPAVSAIDWNKLANAHSAQFWQSRSVIAHRILSRERQHLKHYYEGVSKSPRTMLITRKSFVVNEFPASLCCGGVLWVSVPSDVVGCGSVWFCTCLCVCIASSVCDFLISAVWGKLTNKGCASSSVWDWVKREVDFWNVETDFWWFMHEP